LERHAEILCYKSKDLEALSELMIQFCRLSGDTYKKWASFIEKVKSFKEANSVRKVFTKAFRYCKDKQKIGRDWHEWEKLFGNA